MRTTVVIDDDVLDAARAIAATDDVSIGAALSRLARRGLHRTDRVRGGRIPSFRVPADAAPITPEMVRRALDDDV